MTPQQLIGLGVRLFAVWLGLTSVAYLAAVPSALNAAALGQGNSVAVAYAIGATYMIGALILWFFPMLIAQKILPRTQYANHLAFQAHELARVGCGLLGLGLLAKAVTPLVWFLFRSFIMVDGGSSFSTLPPESKLEVAVSVFDIAFALVLVFKSGAFANLLVSAPSRYSAGGEEL